MVFCHADACSVSIFYLLFRFLCFLLCFIAAVFVSRLSRGFPLFVATSQLLWTKRVSVALIFSFNAGVA